MNIKLKCFLIVLAFCVVAWADELVTQTKVSQRSYYMSAGLGIAHMGGSALSPAPQFGQAVHMSFLANVLHPSVYTGFDLGFHVWSDTAGFVGIPLTASVFYVFPEETGFGVLPYLGVSAGPYLSVSRLNQQSDLMFCVLIRPGANYRLSDKLFLNAEPKFGILGKSAVFIAGLNLAVIL